MVLPGANRPTKGRVLEKGETFGRWVVQGPAPRDARNRPRWHVSCNCGSGVTRPHLTSILTNGQSRSCGCLQRESTSTRGGKGWIGDVERSYKSSAKRRGIEWNLVTEAIEPIVTRPCHYCGLPPSNNKSPRRWRDARWSGIDRVDNTRGYELGNVVPCCKTCNNAKRSLTVEEFMAWARRVVAYNEGGK